MNGLWLLSLALDCLGVVRSMGLRQLDQGNKALSILYMSWFLNYCAPFIYDGGGSPQIYRLILYISLLAQFLVYIIFILTYKINGQIITVRTSIDEGNVDEKGLHYKKQSKSYPGLGDREYRLDQKQFKEWYTHYFGLHSVAVAGCIMYSPYIATVIFALVHNALFLGATIMHSCEIANKIKIGYYATMIFLVLMDLLLLFSISMGVGASGFDTNSKTCYLLQ